ncbi:MAG: hypothetical protein FJ316_07290 [SAR202 cluster bacterium]|nr:hypothetical protein [SAR202 cluster bacterium]
MAHNSDDLPPISPASARWLVITGIVLGLGLALMLLPWMLPPLRDTLLGPSPKAYWYLTRASGLVAYALLWASTAMGLLITGRLSRIWPGGPVAIDLHNFLSMLGLSVTLFHVFILLGDQYIGYNLFSLLAPFASLNYRPVEVAMGQLALYLGWAVTLSFYIRKKIGPRTWRRFHYASFVVYLLALAHGMTAGTDTMTVPVAAMYIITWLATFFLIVYRILATMKAETLHTTGRKSTPHVATPVSGPTRGADVPASSHNGGST